MSLNLVKEDGSLIKVAGNIGNIDDTQVTENNVWSAKKVQEEFGARSTANTILPLLNLQGPFLPKVKNIGAISHRYTYIDGTTVYEGTCTIKVQGNSTAGQTYRKKNYTIKFDKKIDFGWGPQKKYVIKANWIDYTQARNVCTSKLFKQMTESRPDLEDYPKEFKTTPTLGTIDGFPIKVSHNGVYQGRYTLNIPKDEWTYNLKSSNENHGFFMGDSYREACLFRSNSCLWNEYDWTSELQDDAPENIKAKWREVIRFVYDTTDAEFKEHLGDYFYLTSLYDYWILVQCAALGDGLAKNQGYITYDGGNKWIAIAYDMDMSWGLYWDGSYNHLGVPNVSRKNYEDMAEWAAGTTTQYDQYGEPVTYTRGTDGNLLYIRLEKMFKNELRERYRELRKNVLSTGNIISIFDDFCSIMPEDLNKLDYASSTGDGTFDTMPNTPANPGTYTSVGFNYCCIEQLREYIRQRMDNRDIWLYKIPDTLGAKLTSAEQIIDGHYYAFQQTASGAFFNAEGNKNMMNFTDDNMAYKGAATFKAHILEDGTIQFESNEITPRWITYSGKVYNFGSPTTTTRSFGFDELILTAGLSPTTYHFDYGYSGKAAFRFYAEMNHNRREIIGDYTSPIINITEYMYWDRIAEDHVTRKTWQYWWDNNQSRSFNAYSEPFGYDGFVCWHSGELDSLNCWWNVYEVNVTN